MAISKKLVKSEFCEFIIIIIFMCYGLNKNQNEEILFSCCNNHIIEIRRIKSSPNFAAKSAVTHVVVISMHDTDLEICRDNSHKLLYALA